MNVEIISANLFLSLSSMFSSTKHFLITALATHANSIFKYSMKTKVPAKEYVNEKANERSLFQKLDSIDYGYYVGKLS